MGLVAIKLHGTTYVVMLACLQVAKGQAWTKLTPGQARQQWLTRPGQAVVQPASSSARQGSSGTSEARQRGKKTGGMGGSRLARARRDPGVRGGMVVPLRQGLEYARDASTLPQTNSGRRQWNAHAPSHILAPNLCFLTHLFLLIFTLLDHFPSKHSFPTLACLPAK